MTHEEILSMLGDYVDYLIANSSAEAPMWNIEKVRSGKPNKWNYIDGCMITACLSLYHTTGDKKYLDFSKDFIDYFVQAMLNTYSYVIPKVICTVVSACVAAYGFGRFDFPGRKLLFNIMLATLFLPQVVLNVPQYLLYNKFGWLDSPFYLAIWVHCAFATETYFVYQLIQFMRNVPRDLDEAAAIDGCSSFQTLYKVIVPMLGPALVSCALFQFMWSCNDFMGPLLYVSTPGKYPMSLFVKLSMDGDTGFAWNKILALSLISILPQLIVFFCAQDQFVEGISAGAVKG